VLLDEGLLEEDDLDSHVHFPDDYVDFEAVIPYKHTLLSRAFDHFRRGESNVDGGAFQNFRAANAHWLPDYALFVALKNAFGNAAWTDWPRSLAAREPSALMDAREQYREAVEQHEFAQFLFSRQWNSLRSYCRDLGILLFGDLPIYVAHDSADVWAHRDLFYLDDSGRSTVVAGVPPDYFSETGQRWGNPIYRWDLMHERGYAWWTRRFEKIFSLVDLVRLDHFRAFDGYWAIPASDDTAIHGSWVDGPGESLFQAIEDALGPLPLVAENLGMITPTVTDLMEAFGFPGMAVLQFAFGGDAHHAFLPHNYQPNVVAYTGTHDNDTVIGWWRSMEKNGAGSGRRAMMLAREYLALDSNDEQVHWKCVRALMASVAKVVVSPLQDILGLGSEARMNVPGRSDGNWSWRYRGDHLTVSVRKKLKTLTAIYGRSELLVEAIGQEEEAKESHGGV
jgi:4-alpha-glucanotransferase